MGKGSKRRPRQVSEEDFEKNWEKAFGKKPKKKTYKDYKDFEDGVDNVPSY